MKKDPTFRPYISVSVLPILKRQARLNRRTIRRQLEILIVKSEVRK